MYMYVYICIYIYKYVCVCIYIYIYIYASLTSHDPNSSMYLQNITKVDKYEHLHAYIHTESPSTRHRQGPETSFSRRYAHVAHPSGTADFAETSFSRRSNALYAAHDVGVASPVRKMCLENLSARWISSFRT